MSGWGVLKRGIRMVLDWRPLDVQIFGTDPSLVFVATP